MSIKIINGVLVKVSPWLKAGVLAQSVVVAVLVLAGGARARAAETGASFTVSPPIFELRSNPGEQLTEVVSVYNSGSEDLNITSSIENLKPMGEAGQVQVIQDQEGLPSLKDWLVLKEGSFTVKKGESKNLNFTVNVPADAEPGGHFATILFGTTGAQPNGASGALVVQKIGSLVLLTVAGEAKTSANVVSFAPEKKIIWDNGSINFNLRIKNSGSVYVRPRGFLTLTDVFGRKVAQVELDGKNILPNSTRLIPISIESKKFLLGPFVATVSLVYGTSNQNLNTEAGFTVLPWKLLVPIVIAIFLLLIFRRRIRRAVLVLLGRDDPHRDHPHADVK